MIRDYDTLILDKRDYMLSTLDNPYNPYEDFDKWYLYDETSGYHTCGYLARLVATSYDLSEEDQDDAIRIAMESMLETNVTGNYFKVFPDSDISKTFIIDSNLVMND
ncbi:MAG: hypothetical protein LBD57_04485 [Endomicrobium sp.]|uniref:hypothetical protein n=1 Tax=Candidatus Endomicrobiellum cubanum TaxID=3242325 RepID=UPI0028232EAD|nr:hypothetical protein [Endomicrobium sp.]